MPPADRARRIAKGVAFFLLSVAECGGLRLRPNLTRLRGDAVVQRLVEIAREIVRILQADRKSQ
jgi:hypothetical protein